MGKKEKRKEEISRLLKISTKFNSPEGFHT